VIGIENVNEFYTNHYLAAIVGGDVRPRLEQWRAAAREDEANTPWRRLGQLQQEFFRFKDQLEHQRNASARVEAHRKIAAALLGSLGYEIGPIHRELSLGPLPLLGERARGDGEPLLWLLPAPSAHAAEGDVLARPLLSEQHEIIANTEVELDRSKLRALHKHSVEELVTDAFGLEDPPRFVLIIGDTEWVLADRGKWAEQRLLRFDWVELLGRRETETLELVTALLHRESLVPESGSSLVDTLDDSSHKHAYEVSEDLKAALRNSIERIGNEAIRYRREVSKKKVFGEEIDGQELAIQCIRYMYRILFLLYIEARPELGYAPMGSDAYRLGYSFERLRDLEMLELDTPEARDGNYIHGCLDRLFKMVYEGTDAQRQQALRLDDRSRSTEGESVHHTFNMVPLRSHLFDPGRTPFLNFGFVKLRNEVLLEVIKAMSLSAPQGTGKNKRRGRISYATLGINQLGAVYEALLSFRGFFAEETLYEVKPAKGEQPNPVKDPAYFVPESDLKQYKKDERVYDEDGNPKSYPPGSFIYRMAGRDRQKSASYYTPEVLTKCLVKYALKELLENEDGSPKFARAEDLLELTICEPAMGSAAFLNEAINQLAERYLQRRQQELGERIPHDRYRQELQRVRMYIADNNVYGVDLNPIAIELAEVSLWLNAIFTERTEKGTEVFVPWYGGQLACGNSLVGAWRKVFTREQLSAGKDGTATNWLDAVPERIMLGTPRPAGSVYHFLLPDRGMAVYGRGTEGQPIRDMCTKNLAALDSWRAKMCEPLSKEDIAALVRLSNAIDRLWDKHVDLFHKIRERTTDPLSVYGHEHPLMGRRVTTTEEKDRIWSKEMTSEQVRASSPYRRLKLAMDYWCALWFWPIQSAELLPDRDEWLADMALLLDGDVLPDLKGGGDQRELFAPTMPADEARSLLDEVGFADVDKIIQRTDRLKITDESSGAFRFLHWELEFAHLFGGRGGFDLILGNPPWIRIEWKEGDILGDHDPSFVLKKLSGAQASLRRKESLRAPGAEEIFLARHEEAAGLQSFLSSGHAYSVLSGVKVNLYKAFIVQAWTLSNKTGVAGLLHPDGLLDDPNAACVRTQLYGRLRRHYAFINEKKLFADVDNHTRYALNVYGPHRGEPHIVSISNLFVPSTIDESHNDGGLGVVPGLKNQDDNWETTGHRDRVVVVSMADLRLYASLYDEPGTEPLAARLPAVHSRSLVGILQKLAGVGERLETLPGGYKSTKMWHETNATREGLLRRQVLFPKSLNEWVVSGPHFSLGTAFFKCPRETVISNKSYDVIDLVEMPLDYLPRTIYLPGLTSNEYRARAPKISRPSGDVSVLDLYRVVTNRMVGPQSERTLQPAIIPPGVGHLHTVYSYVMNHERDTLRVCGAWMSVVLDFLLKVSGTGEFAPNWARRMPILGESARSESVIARVCVLVCLTQHFAKLWQRNYNHLWQSEKSPILHRHTPRAFMDLEEEWSHGSAVRSAAGRRAVLVEIDVLVAQAFGLSLGELLELLRIQFPVLLSYERDTWYDRNGRIIFTSNSHGLPGVGLPRKKSAKYPTGPYWEDVKHMSAEAGYTGTDPITQTVIDDTLPGGPREKTITYHPPWVRCDRERDYEIAWAHFARRFGLEGHS
jgi:hypothetical protein